MEYDSTKDTLDHIEKVRYWLARAILQLAYRAHVHDASKLQSPEKEGFDRLQVRLADCEYGTDEYKAALEEAKPVIEHHYKQNRHHPEWHPEGINGMNLFDIMEMFFDWKAAGERTKAGNIWKSLKVNRERFGISDQLYSILCNTAVNMGWEKTEEDK